MLVCKVTGDCNGYYDSDDKYALHAMYCVGMVIKLEYIFTDTAVLDVAQKSVKVLFNLVVAHHVFEGCIVIHVVNMLFLFLRIGFSYAPATPPIKSLCWLINFFR